VETQTASHALCECVPSGELRFRRSGKCFMEPRDYDEILLCTVPYFVGRTGLLPE
jgi:hypothetical protein